LVSTWYVPDHLEIQITDGRIPIFDITTPHLSEKTSRPHQN
jgi:hypothetical protein